MAVDNVIPSIKIYVSEKNNDSEVLLNITCGVEEESIPYEVIRCPDIDFDDAVKLAYRGAGESILQVGIGLDSKNSIAVHFKKLPAEKPLFLIDGYKEKDKIRSTCSNAARLVKGTPFI